MNIYPRIAPLVVFFCLHPPFMLTLKGNSAIRVVSILRATPTQTKKSNVAWLLLRAISTCSACCMQIIDNNIKSTLICTLNLRKPFFELIY